MEYSHARAVMTVALSFLLLLHSLSPTTVATKLVEGVCKKTISYANCVEALDSDSRTLSASNLKDLAKIALGLALSNATESNALVELEEDAVTANYDAKIAGDYAVGCENE
ncbi:hypothetical protein FH972_018296 [Carpinus fangiana]|uniref:Pectinesterase inhibitor domain-containing protein n=1 Tax=Carpinus fangiana TaxID=176857 RepID=A0A5N6RQJ0_9ROSI|nr:hypothetical protein FH972_018296 [Carpinus fangiana]